MKLNTMHNIVSDILYNNKSARKDDKFLFILVCEKLGINTATTPMISLYTDKKIPSWETVSRCRRRIQALHPELADPTAQACRQGKIEEYVDYATNKHLD